MGGLSSSMLSFSASVLLLMLNAGSSFLWMLVCSICNMQKVMLIYSRLVFDLFHYLINTQYTNLIGYSVLF